MKEFEVVNNGRQRVVARGDENSHIFDEVAVENFEDGEWVQDESLYWVEDEWRNSATEAFEAILGVISRIVRGVHVDVPPPAKVY